MSVSREEDPLSSKWLTWTLCTVWLLSASQVFCSGHRGRLTTNVRQCYEYLSLCCEELWLIKYTVILRAAHTALLCWNFQIFRHGARNEPNICLVEHTLRLCPGLIGHGDLDLLSLASIILRKKSRDIFNSVAVRKHIMSRETKRHGRRCNKMVLIWRSWSLQALNDHHNMTTRLSL